MFFLGIYHLAADGSLIIIYYVVDLQARGERDRRKEWAGRWLAVAMAGGCILHLSIVRGCFLVPMI